MLDKLESQLAGLSGRHLDSYLKREKDSDKAVSEDGLNKLLGSHLGHQRLPMGSRADHGLTQAQSNDQGVSGFVSAYIPFPQLFYR